MKFLLFGWQDIFQSIYSSQSLVICFQCFDAVVWWQVGHSACKKLSGGMLAWLSFWGEVQICICPS